MIEIIKEFPLSISALAYKGKCNDWGKVTYQTEKVDINKIESYVKEGRCFTHTFKVSGSEPFSTKSKTIANFNGTNTVFIDIDDSNIAAPLFQQTISTKPSLLYTTPSNITGEKNRYRLIYLFDDMIKSNDEYKLLVNAIVDKISDEIAGFELKDRTCVNCSQQMGGNSNQDITIYKTYNVFYKEDFITNTEHYSNSCFSKQYKKEKRNDILNGNAEASENVELLHLIDAEFISDFWNFTDERSYIEIRKKHSDKYPIHNATQTDALQPFIKLNDEYIDIPRKTYKYKDHHGSWQECPQKVKKGDRERILFCNALLRLKMIPEMTFEHLLFCLLYERQIWIDNSDGTITNKVLYKIAKGAFLKRTKYNPQMKESQRRKRAKYKTGHKVNPSFCESQGLSARSVANHIRGYLSDKTLDEHYDFSKSVKENHIILKKQGIKPNSERRLYKYLKDKGIGTKDYTK